MVVFFVRVYVWTVGRLGGGGGGGKATFVLFDAVVHHTDSCRCGLQNRQMVTLLHNLHCSSKQATAACLPGTIAPPT